MKFLALLKKEVRESLIPIILATLVFGGFTAFMIREFVNYGGVDARFSGQRDRLGEVYGLFSSYPVQQIGPLLLCTSILLGLALGALHFGLPMLSRTWAFLLHRPVNRFAVLASKFLASLLAFGVALGVPWSWAYLHIEQVKTTGFPSNPQVFWEGWLLICLGLGPYLGTGLCALKTARWYTTRLFGLIFAAILVSLVFSTQSIVVAFMLLLIGVAILLMLLIATFLKTEF